MNEAQKWLLIMAAVLGGIAVAAGAFGAHALKRRLDMEMLNAFEVGVRYQMYHALAIAIVVLASAWLPGHSIMSAGWLFLLGTCIFSGSLYLLALTGVKTFGAITPIGGLLLIAGWGMLVIALLKNSSTSL